MSMFKLTTLTALLAVSGAAQALTLDTSGWKSQSVQTFTVSAYGSATAAGVRFEPVGNTVRLPDVTVIDPESGLEETVPSFDFPVTSADVSIGWNLKITPTSGKAARAGLKLLRGNRAAALANFRIDFTKDILYADIITAAGTTVQAPLYTFVDNNDTAISLKGFVLNQSGSLKTMVFTPEAQALLTPALALSEVLAGTLVRQDWGTVAIKVTSYKRTPKLNVTPLTAADVGITQTPAP